MQDIHDYKADKVKRGIMQNPSSRHAMFLLPQ